MAKEIELKVTILNTLNLLSINLEMIKAGALPFIPNLDGLYPIVLASKANENLTSNTNEDL